MQIRQRPANSDHCLPEELHPVLQRIFAGRDVSTAAEIDYPLENLLPFGALKNIHAAVALLQDAAEQNKAILIIADYDADGATACAVALRGLSAMGVKQVSYLVPDRAKHGYGLSLDVARLALDYDPDLIVTVDNGIASIDGIAFARQAGVDVLVTDHHLPGANLPEATVIINPNQHGDEFASKHLAGVGVMFYVLLALRARLREQGWFEARALPVPHLAALLDLVALGTIADVVRLDYNNRILVHQGLRRIRHSRCCPGMLALLQVAGREPEKITSSDLGYLIGPRLNAAGRLQDMSIGIECLISDDPSQALALAHDLDALNRERKAIQADMQQAAEQHLQAMRAQSAGRLPDGVCLYSDSWHQGVIGILASRIKEDCNRPVFVFAADEDGDLKGSGRSVAGVHLKDVLESLASQSPDLIMRFGGHAMAAGLTITRENYAEFCQLFDAEIKKITAGQAPGNDVLTDGELDHADFSVHLAQQIAAAGPWGQGFPEPVFNGSFFIAHSRTVGDKHLQLKLRVADDDRLLNAIAFNTSEHAVRQADTVELVYQLAVNDYQGQQSLQLLIKHIQCN